MATKKKAANKKAPVKFLSILFDNKQDLEMFEEIKKLAAKRDVSVNKFVKRIWTNFLANPTAIDFEKNGAEAVGEGSFTIRLGKDTGLAERLTELAEPRDVSMNKYAKRILYMYVENPYDLYAN